MPWHFLCRLSTKNHRQIEANPLVPGPEHFYGKISPTQPYLKAGFDVILERGDSKPFKILSPRFWVRGIFGEMAKIFDFCSSKGGTYWWKWRCEDGGMYDIGRGAWGGGGLLNIILERRDSKTFKMLSRGFGWDIW
jgi:hypothetical protein